MKESANPNDPATVFRDWADCDLFCITGYGTGHPCGWRGRFHEADWDEDRGLRRCPRCREVSLLGVPSLASMGDDEPGNSDATPHGPPGATISSQMMRRAGA